MTIADIEQFFETWAPRWVAWDRDNVGLQVGDRSRRVSKILIALDVTEEIIDEAASRKADLIISHHPLLFRSPKSITPSDEVGRLVLLLAQKNIALYSAHTNLDFTRDGVSFALAQAVGLTNVRFLSPLKNSLAKIAVFVPENYIEQVADAMSQAGAGVIGEYTSCSFRLKGSGTFRGSATTNPFSGAAGRLETVEEVRLEMLAPRAKVPSIITAMENVHPYEEVAYDVYPVENTNPNYGMGALGELPKPTTLKAFLQRVKKSLSAEGIRYRGNLNQKIFRIGVCGGSGSELLAEALSAKADVFLTADVRYHTYHTAQGRIALVDAGHWETEHIILEPIAQRLEQLAKKSGERVQVFVTEHCTNPTHCL